MGEGPAATLSAPATLPIAPPEPHLTHEALIGRARDLRAMLRARQADCEAAGKVPDDVNAALISGGFYRTIQPRRFGGYEFDVPAFYRVMMELSRGCAETGWVVALTAGHPLLLASFPEQAQREAYGTAGDLRCPAAFTPPGTAIPADGGFRVTGSWPSASGIDHSTHFIGSALVREPAHGASPRVVQVLLDRAHYAIVDDWQVMGMRGTGSKRVVAADVLLPAYRTLDAVGPGRGSEPATRGNGMHANPMYSGRILAFLIGEAAAVAVGSAGGALELYEDLLRTKKSRFPPHHEQFKDAEFQHHYGRAAALVATAEAALVRAGEDYMDFAREEAAGGETFHDERENRLILVEQQCIRLAWEAMELIYRTAGTTASAREGEAIGRALRNMAVINTHPALQIDRTAGIAARTRFGLQPPTVPPRNGPAA